MAYRIRRSNGVTVADIPDLSVNSTATSIKLFGRSIVDYGADMAENLVHILENFANSSPPTSPSVGQLWYDLSLDPAVMKFFDGALWRVLGSTLGGYNLPQGGTTVGGGTGGANRAAGAVAVIINNGPASTSAVAIIAEGKIIAMISPETLLNSQLPTTLVIEGRSYAFKTRFPNGLAAGQTLAADVADYIFSGVLRTRDPLIGSEASTKNYSDTKDQEVLTTTRNELKAAIPPGIILLWYGLLNNVPAGWTLCNGTPVTRADGSGPITPPDLRGRFVIGAGPDYAPGVFGGAEEHSATTTSNGGHTHAATTEANGAHSHGSATGSHILSIEQIPNHSHIVSQLLIDVNIDGSNPFNGTNLVDGGGANNVDTSAVGGGQGHTHPIASDGNHDHDVTVEPVAAHAHDVTVDTMPPYYALAYIMRI